MSSSKYKPKFFPFSAGIPWKVQRGKYILPEIDSVIWHRVLDERDIIITAFGGLLESFFSLCAAEALFSFDPNHKIYWLGNEKYSFFRMANGLCKPCNINLLPSDLERYPTPIFFDKKDNAYLNLLSNYKTRKSYWGKHPEKVLKPSTEQISDNVMVPWNDYIPKMRSLGTEYFDELQKTGRLKKISRYALIILDSDDDNLQWSNQNIKEFAQLAYNSGLKTIVFSNDTSRFYGTRIISCTNDIRKIVQVIPNAWVTMSSSVEWLLISMMLSSSSIISRRVEGCFDLLKNAEFLGVENSLSLSADWISPIDAHSICEGLL